MDKYTEIRLEREELEQKIVQLQTENERLKADIKRNDKETINKTKAIILISFLLKGVLRKLQKLM